MSEHSHLHPEAGEYWKRNARPDHYIINAVHQWRDCMAFGNPVPSFLWKQVAPIFGFDANKQPDKLKKPEPFTAAEWRELNDKIAKLEALAREQGAIKQSAPQTRAPMAVPGAE